jgi:rSAM/selenodomain-associated transferase 2
LKLDISLITPTYNEQENVRTITENVNLLKPKEVIIVDGNSTDNTRKLLKNFKIIKTKASRGAQLKKGAKHSKQKWFFFIHADTKLHIENIKDIKYFINKENINKVGFFHLKFNHSSIFAYLISKWANFRSKVFNMPFGDQCLLINRLYYESIGGYEEIDKMEDMEIMLKIPNKNKFFFKSYIETSFNKYENNGILTQSFKNIFNQIFFILR